MEQKGALAIQPFVHHRCHVRTEAHALHYFLERLGIPWVVLADDGLLIKNGRFLWESWVFSSLQRGVSDRIWCMQYTFPLPSKMHLWPPRFLHFWAKEDPYRPCRSRNQRFQEVEPTYRFHDCISATWFRTEFVHEVRGVSCGKWYWSVSWSCNPEIRCLVQF